MDQRTSAAEARPRVRRRRRRLAVLSAAVVAGSLVGAACAPGSPSEAPPVNPSDGPVASPSRPDAQAGTAPTTAPTTTTTSTTVPPASWVTPGERPGLGGCPLFPADHAYRASVGSLPVNPRSTAMIGATIAASEPGEVGVNPGFSSAIWEGSRSGIPFNVVDGAAAKRVDFVVSYDYHDTPSEAGVPLPERPRFEGWPGIAWDRHLVVVDTSTCESRELIGVRTPAEDVTGLGGGRWFADAAAKVDLRSNERSEGVATASQISLLAGLVRFDELATGQIDHALSATLHMIRAEEHVWPAMGTDGRSDSPDAIPMGSWLRLRGDVDLSRFGAQARVVAEAMRDHGVVITDSGPGFKLQGDPDPRWDDDDLDTLEGLSLADFDIVDPSSMMVSPESYQIRTR